MYLCTFVCNLSSPGLIIQEFSPYTFYDILLTLPWSTQKNISSPLSQSFTSVSFLENLTRSFSFLLKWVIENGPLVVGGRGTGVQSLLIWISTKDGWVSVSLLHSKRVVKSDVEESSSGGYRRVTLILLQVLKIYQKFWNILDPELTERGVT